MTRQKKIIVWVLSGLVLVGLMVFSFPYLWLHYQGWKIGYNYKQFENAFLNYLKSDTYGGKTPQQTYEMYVDALKSNDLEKAGKYYWWDKQIKEQKRLEELRDQNKLQEYIDSLPDWSEMKEEEYWNKDGKRYVKTKMYIEAHTLKLPLPDIEGKTEMVVPPGEYAVFSITFHLNKHANIWKIY